MSYHDWTWKEKDNSISAGRNGDSYQINQMQDAAKSDFNFQSLERYIYDKCVTTTIITVQSGGGEFALYFITDLVDREQLSSRIPPLT